MSIARIDEAALLAFGMDRQTVAALRHMIRQVGPEVGATNLPTVAAQTVQVPALIEKAEVLDLTATLTDDVVSNGAVEVPLVVLAVPNALKAGALLSGRIVGVTSNGNIPGTLNLWLAIGGVKVLTHAFTTPDVIGAGKGFAADFSLIVRAPGSVMAGGVLSLAYNAPTVLPLASLAPVAVSAGAGVALTLGMHWTAANAANIATVKVAYLSADKL